VIKMHLYLLITFYKTVFIHFYIPSNDNQYGINWKLTWIKILYRHTYAQGTY